MSKLEEIVQEYRAANSIAPVTLYRFDHIDWNSLGLYADGLHTNIDGNDRRLQLWLEQLAR